MDVAGSTALVTGGALRIGEAICRALADAGCNVVIHYDQSEERACGLAEVLKTEGVQAWTVQEHFAPDGDPAQLVDRAWNVSGRVNILINNASTFYTLPLLDSAAEDIRNELESNLVAPMLLSKRFAERLMHESDGASGELALGHVVNILDRRIAQNESGCIPYLVSKKGLAEFTRATALEWAPQIVVNGVAPGAILPPVMKMGAPSSSEPMGAVPLGRQCTPEDVADAVLHLLHSVTMTGQVLFIDGGQNLL
ncbi:MAG: SDR family oxidoreductase [Kiritimatiellae bacterium]|nr:SDR family oxidoreductase [Kiritimatiellia bacterium]